MEIKKEQYEQIKECFPKQRKPAKISNLDVLNAVLYVVENGCKWRSLPKEYGDWHVIYVRINRWAKKGVLERVFLRLQQLGIIQIQVNVISLDSTCIKVHPDGMGDFEKDTRTRHIHAVKWDGTEWKNYINFRDYLNCHPDKAMIYDACKKKLALQFPDDRRSYTEGKQECIECLLKEAYVWRQRQDT